MPGTILFSRVTSIRVWILRLSTESGLHRDELDGGHGRTPTCYAGEMATSKVPSRQLWVEAYVKGLIKSGQDVNQTDKNGVTPLHHAVRFRSPKAVRALLENGARVNQACTRSGSTPLHRAVTSTGAPGTAGKQAEAIQIIGILLEFGASPAIKNNLGKKPIDYARDPEILRQLKKVRAAKS